MALQETGHRVGLLSNGRDAADRVRVEGFRVPKVTRAVARRMSDQVVREARLQPVRVARGRDPATLQRILETLARLEPNDGLTLTQLLAEVSGQLPRDATVLALLGELSPDQQEALGELVHQGYAVAVVMAVYEPDRYRSAAARLLDVGIQNVRHLRDESSIGGICRRMAIAGIQWTG